MEVQKFDPEIDVPFLFQVDIKPYEDIKSFLRDGQHKKVWLSNQASHGLAACIPVAQPPEISNTGYFLGNNSAGMAIKSTYSN